MAQGDVELADRIAEAVNTRDLEWLEATAHPDLEYHPTIAAAGGRLLPRDRRVVAVLR